MMQSVYIVLFLTFGDGSTQYKPITSYMAVPEPLEVCIAENQSRWMGHDYWQFECLTEQGTFVKFKVEEVYEA
jgi:hypothetical protein